MKKITYLLAIIFTIAFTSSQAQNCHADFQYFKNGLTVSFVDSSIASSTALYNWEFGDSSFSSFMNPTHTYNQAGNYQVCLFVFDTAINCADTICKTVVVGNVTPPCHADFVYMVSPNGFTNFTNLSANPSSYNFTWNFGDNSPTSSLISPNHTYTNQGIYVVSLTAQSGNQTCTKYDTVFVGTCSASYVYQNVGGGTVNFINSSLNNKYGVEYNWDFGDNTTTQGKNVSHTYLNSGLYVVSLSLYDSINNCRSTYVDSLLIQLTPTACTASYTIVKDTAAPFSVILYNTSSNLSTHQYAWDFGDGNFGTGRTPSHQYANFGSYVVCLTVFDSIANCSATFCDTVGMDSLGNLNKAGFGIQVIDPLAVSLEENKLLNQIKIYPNPASKHIFMDLNGLDQLTIKVLDISGRLVLERTSSSKNIENIDISQLENGIYFISLQDGINRRVEKMIISR